MPDEATLLSESLPTEEEIRQLPRRARVAFAARCARRVLSLFIRSWPDAPAVYRLAVTYAVDLSEATAAEPVSGSYYWQAANAAQKAQEAAHTATVESAVAPARTAADAARAANFIGADNAAALKAADTAVAADAAAAAAAAAIAATIDDSFHPCDATDVMAAAAASHAAAADIASAPTTSSLIRRDFLRLLDKSRLERWTDDTPVPPSVFGPIDEPADEPKPPKPVLPPDPLTGLRLKATIAPGVSAETVQTHSANVYHALQNLLRVKFGHELTREQFDRMLTVERREA